MNPLIAQYKLEMTQRFISAIEAGQAPWQRELTPSMTPRNAITGRLYEGINQLILTLINEGQDPRWATYYEAQKHQWQVQKGSRGVKVTLWKPLIDLETEEETGVVIQRIFTVFNASQIEGIQAFQATEQTEPEYQNTGAIIELIGGMLNEKNLAIYRQLVSEIGAMFLITHAGRSYKPVNYANSKQVIEYLRSNPNGIFTIAGAANKAVKKLIRHKEAI